MLEKLATHVVESVTTLFALVDKCARAAEGHAWHSVPQDRAAKAGGFGATIQGGGKKKKKNRGCEGPQSGAQVIAAMPRGQNTCAKRPRQQGGNSSSCPVHPTTHHSDAECRKIQKLVKRVSE